MEPSKGLADSQRFEPIEIRAVANYLLKSSQPFEYISAYTGITQQPSAERGKKLFETRGCLACHQHADFPQGQATQGPNLSRIGAKLSLQRDGAKWLYSWLRQPSHYHARTVMPNMFLTPITEAAGKVTDPAADITAFLMGSHAGLEAQRRAGAKRIDAGRARCAVRSGAVVSEREVPVPAAGQSNICRTAFRRARRRACQGTKRLLVADGSDDPSSGKPSACCCMSAGARSASKAAPAATTFRLRRRQADRHGLADWGRKTRAAGLRADRRVRNASCLAAYWTKRKGKSGEAGEDRCSWQRRAGRHGLRAGRTAVRPKAG